MCIYVFVYVCEAFRNKIITKLFAKGYGCTDGDMTLLALFPVILGQIHCLIINQHNVKLKPDKQIVEYKINKRAFGFQAQATINVTVTCVSWVFFFESVYFVVIEPTPGKS